MIRGADSCPAHQAASSIDNAKQRRPISENHLQLKLYLSRKLVERRCRRKRWLCPLSPQQCPAENTVVARVQQPVGIPEIRMIQRVEKICAKNDLTGLAEPAWTDRFRDREIQVPKSRPGQSITPKRPQSVL